MGFVVGVVVGDVGCRNVWREKLCLFEKPFDAVFPLAWSKAGRGCESRSIPSSLTVETTLVRTPEGAASVLRRRGVRVRWVLWEVCEDGRIRSGLYREDGWFTGWIVPSP